MTHALLHACHARAPWGGLQVRVWPAESMRGHVGGIYRSPGPGLLGPQSPNLAELLHLPLCIAADISHHCASMSSPGSTHNLLIPQLTCVHHAVAKCTVEKSQSGVCQA